MNPETAELITSLQLSFTKLLSIQGMLPDCTSLKRAQPKVHFQQREDRLQSTWLHELGFIDIESMKNFILKRPEMQDT